MDREEVNDDVKVTVDISHVKTILFSDHLEQTFQQNSGTQGCNLRTPDLLAVMNPTLTAALGSMGSLSDIWWLLILKELLKTEITSRWHSGSCGCWLSKSLGKWTDIELPCNSFNPGNCQWALSGFPLSVWCWLFVLCRTGSGTGWTQAWPQQPGLFQIFEVDYLELLTDCMSSAQHWCSKRDWVVMRWVTMVTDVTVTRCGNTSQFMGVSPDWETTSLKKYDAQSGRKEEPSLSQHRERKPRF